MYISLYLKHASKDFMETKPTYIQLSHNQSQNEMVQQRKP